MKEIRLKIDNKRKKLGLTITGVAKDAGISRNQYKNMIRKDDYNFTIETLLPVLYVVKMKLVVKDIKL